MAERKKSSKKSGSGPGCILWVAFLLLITGLFLFNRELIVKTLKNTRFSEKVLQKKDTPTEKPAGDQAPAPREQPMAPPAAAPAAPTADTPSPQKPTEPAAKPDAQPAASPTEKPAVAPTKPEAKPVAIKPESKPVVVKPQAAPASQKPVVAPAKPPTAKPAAPPAETPRPTAKSAERGVWFMSVGSDGSISRTRILRKISASDSPLSDALNALLTGPTEDERQHGISSLIPAGTKLISAIVRGSTAYLNLSEAFQFNSYGIEGYAAQLKEVVWTATEFENVQDVQILIEGRRVDYLGSEGIWIGSPVNRNSF